MVSTSPTIYLIDDDASVRRALGRVMHLARLDWEAFDSAESFLANAKPSSFGCIVADITLTGISGLELKSLLDARGVQLPFILLTAHDTEETRSAARSAGATAYFRKPVDIEALLDAIQWSTHPA
jgi:FixJ family two-component response regulator